MGKQFSEEYQPTNRRGPGKLKKALALLEEMGIDPLVQAIKQLKKAKDPAKKAELWLKINRLVRPEAKDDVPVSPEQSLKIVSDLFAEAKLKYVEKSLFEGGVGGRLETQGSNTTQEANSDQGRTGMEEKPS